ncbi:peptidase M20 [Kitasatospora sp. NPDC048365]|uniref:peptidase M20 n=1 Tax=Kitasatospora sp. NPDC048365 TaxID=3364050 RepID=UPI0037225403
MSPVPVWAATGLLPVDCELLLHLLQTPPATPPGPHGVRAMERYAAAADRLGLATVHFGSPLPAELDRPDVPPAVRRAVAEQPGYLADRPSLVLRLGPARSPARTVMVNVRLDAAPGSAPVSFDGRRVRGPGANGGAGPAVALLAGIRAALAMAPALVERITVLVQLAAGGAGGVLGTRPLVERGYVGALNVFCEPTGLRWLPRATAASTARLRVRGEDAAAGRTDGRIEAAVLLGFLAQYLARELADRPVRVGGLAAGPLPGVAAGDGELLLQLPYGDAAAGRAAERAVEAAVAGGLARFRADFADLPGLARTAGECARITAVDWLQRGLPVLDSHHPALERLLTRAGFARWPGEEPAFVSDAIWTAGLPDTLTVLFGPGTAAPATGDSGESVDLDRLDEFADAVARLLTAFAASTADD